MNKILLTFAIASSMMLTACNEPVQLVRTEIKVVDIPDRFKDMCPEIKRLPNVSTLTDKQVADLIVRLWQTSKNCRTAILGIYEYQRVAKSGLENKPIY
jgi:hypothetical protein